MTINEANGKPYEVFIASTSSKYTDWTTTLSLLLSALMKRGEDVSFIPDVLKKVVSSSDAGYVDGTFYGSLVGLFGDVLHKHINRTSGSSDPSTGTGTGTGTDEVRLASGAIVEKGETCPSCNMPTVFRQEGCSLCTNCGFSTCG